MTEANERMQKCADAFTAKMKTMRAGRATPALLDKIVFDSYGIKTSLKHAASVSVLDDRTLIVRVWDKANLNAVVNAMVNSDVGVSPTVDSEGSIRALVPPLTQEWRDKLVKLTSQEAEKTRIAIRAIRRDLMHDIKTQMDEHELSRNDYDRQAAKIQLQVDKYIAEIDKQLAEKQKEITQV